MLRGVSGAPSGTQIVIASAASLADSRKVLAWQPARMANILFALFHSMRRSACVEPCRPEWPPTEVRPYSLCRCTTLRLKLGLAKCECAHLPCTCRRRCQRRHRKRSSSKTHTGPGKGSSDRSDGTHSTSTHLHGELHDSKWMAGRA